MSIEVNIEKSVKVIKRIKDSGNFQNYITRIVFPYFKNYSYFSELTFDFPLTIFVGKNGTGKSSALHALFGAPRGNNIGDYWFSTELDPIEEFGENGERPAYFYEYEANGQKIEVLYQRMFKEGRTNDYWETSIARKKYKMNNIGIRGEVLNKNKIHLDFRKELSAFDKFFYFGSVEKLKSKTPQDYLRRQSKELNNVLVEGSIRKKGTKFQNKRPINLTKVELDVISFILEEEYSAGRIIEHKYFERWGTSVILTKNEFRYSEAQAGSGEIAIVMLVHNILAAPPQTLVLLDEPEVSLHPTAQKKLLIFLLEEIKRKKLQIIIATHSPLFTEDLPKEAIKRFAKNIDTNKTDLYNECYPIEAFKHLGLVSKYEGILIHVEDNLMKYLIEQIIELSGSRFESIEVYFTPGGAKTIQNSSITYYSQEQTKKKFVYLDGDQKTDTYIPDLDELQLKHLNVNYLGKLIKDITNREVVFIKDGGTGQSRDDQIVEAQKNYIEYYKKRVKFFPTPTPEDLIWDIEYIKNILQPILDTEILTEIESMETAKKKIHLVTKLMFGEDSDVHTLERLLVTNWLSKKDENFDQIIKDLTDFVEIVHEIKEV